MGMPCEEIVVTRSVTETNETEVLVGRTKGLLLIVVVVVESITTLNGPDVLMRTLLILY